MTRVASLTVTAALAILLGGCAGPAPATAPTVSMPPSSALTPAAPASPSEMTPGGY